LPNKKVGTQKTVSDAIQDLPKMKVVKNGRRSHQQIGEEIILNHEPRFHNDRDISIFKELAKDLARKERKYKTVEDLKKLYTEKTGKTSSVHKYHVLDPNKPSNTIVAHLHRDGLRHIHPDPNQARSITVREAGRLQTFPDDFEFLGGMGDQYKMIGNAVPPLLAKVIAESLYELFDKCSNNNKSSIM
jgi:DNA (cytosine-5)-methyltransferase 1